MWLVVLSSLQILRCFTGIQVGYHQEDSSIQSSSKIYHIPSKYLTAGQMLEEGRSETRVPELGEVTERWEDRHAAGMSTWRDLP